MLIIKIALLSLLMFEYLKACMPVRKKPKEKLHGCLSLLNEKIDPSDDKTPFSIKGEHVKLLLFSNILHLSIK
jgi:hypothetical protein